MRALAGLTILVLPVWFSCGGGGGSSSSADLSGDDVSVSQEALASSTALADCLVAASQLLQFTPVMPEVDLDTAAIFAQLFQCPKLAPGSSPTHSTFDWGTGCRGRDGRTRRGSMSIDARDAVLEDGSIALTVIGYGDDHTLLDGSVDVSFQQQGVIRYTLTHLTLTLAQPYAVTGELFVTVETASNPMQTAYEVSGGGTVGGVAFSIETPLRIQQDCAHPLRGTMSITLSGDRQAHADFGSDSCDDVVALTVGESWQEVHLE